jgi:histidinol-phosphate/aromatic aminotransferase/cobyric acid decarboxylase-like protein
MNVYDLSLNQSIAKTCPAANRYPKTRDLISLLANHHKVHEENILVVSGADQGIDVTFREREPGSQITILDPDFPRYEALAKINRHRIEKIPIHGFEYPSLDHICKILHNTNSALFITSTVSNPTGPSLSSQSIERLYFGKPEQSTLIVDETYGDFIGSDSASFIVSQNDNVCSLNSFSKRGYPGLRLGYIVAPTAFTNRLKNYVSRFACATQSIEMAESILKAGEWQKLIARQIQNREWLANQLRRRGLTTQSSAGNWVLTHLGESAELIVALLEQKGFLIQLQSQAFLNGWVRISTPIEQDVLAQFLVALDEVMSRSLLIQPLAA